MKGVPRADTTRASGRWLLPLLAAALGCGGGRSTLGVSVSADPADLPIRTLRLVAIKGGRVAVDQRYDWSGPTTYGLYFPGDVSGSVDVRGEGTNESGAIIAVGHGRGTVNPGLISGPVALVLTLGPGVVLPDAGVADAGASDAGVDAGEPDSAADASAPPDVAVPDARDAESDLRDTAADARPDTADAQVSPDVADAMAPADGPLPCPARPCQTGDGCCPTACNANSDQECLPVCGNGVLEASESCDPPAMCAASHAACTGSASTIRTRTGDPALCTFRCVEASRACNAAPDTFCPAGCTAAQDPDCPGDLGQTCASPAACTSGKCVDGKCCNEDCTGPCRTCATGTCLPITSGDDTPACPVGNTCGPGGQCRKKNGQSCLGTAECDSGYCADGKCCNEACTAGCQSCGTGVCAQVRDAPDVPECSGGKSCDSQGACVPPPAVAPTLVSPWNGEATGSHLAMNARRPVLRWKGVSGASSYEIDIDDSCSVSGFASCTFASPEVHATATSTTYQPAALPVSMVKPVGRRYFWRVRACNAAGCSPWSVVRYVDVGRQSHDFNGDGYADVLSGTAGAANESWLFLGGPAANDVVDLKPRGTHVAAAGDVNGDGYADMLIGEDSFGVLRAYVYFGGATPDAVADVTMNGMAGETFGDKLSGAGDLDADGFADVVLASAPVDPDAGGGHIYVYRGGSAMDGVADLVVPPTPGWRLGGSVGALGDIDGDGYHDFAALAPDLGAPGFSQLMVFTGGPTLVPTAAFTASSSGHRLATGSGDLNGDGRGELAVVRGELVWVHFGGSDPNGVPDLILPKLGSGTPSLSIGDIDRDGFADLLVGYDGSETAHVFRGGAQMDALADATIVSDTPSNDFGIAVSIFGDLNGDGFFDLAVGASYHQGARYASGRVYVFFGGQPLDMTIDLRFNGLDGEDTVGAMLAALEPRRPNHVAVRQPRRSWRTWAWPGR
jgi:hypothetical protein